MDNDMVSIEVVMVVKMPKNEFEAWAKREGISKVHVRQDIRTYMLNFVKHSPLIDEGRATVTVRKGAHNA